MTDSHIREITDKDRISAKYRRSDVVDAPRHENIIPFEGQMCCKSLGLMNDIHALLDDPYTRPLTQDILTMALQHIASNFVQGDSAKS